jgi:hypothetical protein
MSTSSAKPDDLEAVRTIASTLEPFKADERERILRWAREKLGMTTAAPTAVHPPAPQFPDRPGAPATPVPAGAASGATPMMPSASADIRSFVETKAPRSLNELATVVAFYLRFVAPDAKQKEAITKDDLVEACRKVGRAVPERPEQVLVNTHGMGLLDRTSVRGAYELNAVGENLVALTLPSADGSPTRQTKKKNANGKASKKPGRGRAQKR